jgi:hypothetical protein
LQALDSWIDRLSAKREADPGHGRAPRQTQYQAYFA